MSDKPSKSALKRQYHELQRLGEALIELTDEQLRRVPLEPDLYDAVRAAGKMKAHGALRRQRQLIGKMMRSADATAIRDALRAVTQSGRLSKQQFHDAERWRDRILAEGSPALAEFTATRPDVRTPLEALVTSLSRSRDDDDRRRLGKQVFRLVHAALDAEVHNNSD